MLEVSVDEAKAHLTSLLHQYEAYKSGGYTMKEIGGFFRCTIFLLV